MFLSIGYLMMNDLEKARVVMKTLKQVSVIVSTIRAFIEFENDKISNRTKSIKILDKTLTQISKKK